MVEALPTSAKRSSTTVSSSSGTSAAEEGNKRARGGPEEPRGGCERLLLLLLLLLHPSSSSSAAPHRLWGRPGRGHDARPCAHHAHAGPADAVGWPHRHDLLGLAGDYTGPNADPVSMDERALHPPHPSSSSGAAARPHGAAAVHAGEPRQDVRVRAGPVPEAVHRVHRGERVGAGGGAYVRGKTVVAEYAVARSINNNQRVVYPEPIKALSTSSGTCRRSLAPTTWGS